MSMYDAAVIVYPYHPVFEALAELDPMKYKIFHPKDFDHMEAFINICAPLKILVMMVCEYAIKKKVFTI